MSLPPEPDGWGSRRQATPTPKQKRVVSKGSAIKRSRVHMSVAATRGPTRGQSDADSRFPMPYPGVGRGPAQLQHHQHHLGQRKSPKQGVADHSGSRRVHSIEEHNHGPADRRLRTRPRSAMVMPPSQTVGSGSGRVKGGLQPPKSKGAQDVSNTAVIGERDRRGGSKRLRYANASDMQVSSFLLHSSIAARFDNVVHPFAFDTLVVRWISGARVTFKTIHRRSVPYICAPPAFHAQLVHVWFRGGLLPR